MSKKPPPQHPGTKMAARLSEKGLDPLSIEEQWNDVADWYNFLLTEESDNYPIVAGLKEIWAEMESLFSHEGKSVIQRGHELSSISSTPLSTFFYFIEMGFYPPPELLLTLGKCWDLYEASGGDTTLEEAFLGKPIRKGGNYARRHASNLRKHMMLFQFDEQLRNGMSREEAAQEVSRSVGGKPDADSILRMFRGFSRSPETKEEE